MSIQEAAQQAQANLCEDTLDDLAVTCRHMAKGVDAPVDLSLALCHVFGGISRSLHDRPVATPEIGALLNRLGPLFETLKDHGISEKSRAAIVDALKGLRGLF